MDVIFFSRGRGKGHAIPDIALMKEVVACWPSLSWSFASYSTGADTLKSHGYAVLDMSLPEEGSILPALMRAAELIHKHAPRVLVSHEEPAAILAGRLAGIPSIFITDWFLTEQAVSMQALAFADSILFLERRGLFDEPSYLRGKVTYLGPFVRNMAYVIGDRQRARHELGIDVESVVVACLPGGWATEARAPLSDLLLAAFRGLDSTRKNLVWAAGRDHVELPSAKSHLADVDVKADVWPVEQLMVAADVVITKGNRITTLEAASLGVPTISLSYGNNPVEDIILPHIACNRMLRVHGIDAAYLSGVIQEMLTAPPLCSPPPFTVSCASIAAVLIAKLKELII